MKLLFDCTELSYYNENSGHKAGVYTVALNLCKEFVKLGIDIIFYCDYKRYYFFKDIKEFKHIPLLEEYSLLNRIIGKSIYYSRFLPLKFRYLLIMLARFYDKFKNINRKNIAQLNQYDLYFSPFTPPSKDLASSSLKRFRMIHDVIPMLEFGRENVLKNNFEWYGQVYSTISEKEYYLTNSENTRKDVLKYFPFIKEENIKTVYLGASDKFKPEPDNNENNKYIFSLCTLGKRKNLEFGIRNFFAFIEKHNISNLKLVVGGSIWNKYKSKFNKIINNYDKSKIILTGYLGENELSKYYSNAICFIYPSLYEGFGLPVLEAMQCGCPVITSNRTSLPEVIGDAGIQVNPESDEEMINAFEKMYYDNSFRERCIYRGLERAKCFSWENCAREIIEYIEDVKKSKLN